MRQARTQTHSSFDSNMTLFGINTFKSKEITNAAMSKKYNKKNDKPNGNNSIYMI